jgi:energy-coupling factor transporter ATP-binding protein EcfA2
MSLFRKPVFHAPETRKTNPFATRFFTPGAIPFYLGAVSMDSLVEQIIQGGRPSGTEESSRSHSGSNRNQMAQCFAIVGPHGTGKSTLLAQLEQALLKIQPSSRCGSLFLNTTTPSSHRILRSLQLLRANSICLIDGFEQIPKLGQSLCASTAKTLRRKLIVTSHALPNGFAALWNTRMSEEIERYVIGYLLGLGRFTEQVPNTAKSDGSTRHAGPTDNLDLIEVLLHSQEWRSSRAKHRENLRECLFDMYDWWGNRVDEIPGNR